MPPIGTITSLVRDWTRWHSTRQLATHTTKLAAEELVRELSSVTLDRDPKLTKALRLIDELERLSLSVRPTPPDLRKLRARTAELKQGMRL